MQWKVPRAWEGSECWIIGGGPSIPRLFHVPEPLISDIEKKAIGPEYYSKYMQPIHDKHVIGVNNAYQIGNWIDVLFFGDCPWYRVHRYNLAQFPGLKVTCCPRFAGKEKKESEGIKYLQKDKTRRYGISDNPRKVAWNSNSGAAAISLAVHFGVRRIYLLGFDMKIQGSETHWHGGHGNKNAPPFRKHLKGFPDIAKDAKNRNVEIINVSPSSAIMCFPKRKLEDVL